MTNRVEELLTRTLVDYAERAPQGPVPLVSPKRSGRTAFAVVASVLIVVAMAIVTGVVSRSTRSETPPTSSTSCASRFDAARKEPPGPSEVLVPGQPVSIVRCVYGTEQSDAARLIAAHRLSGRAAQTLVRALNALRPDPCRCRHGGTPAAGRDEILYLYYADGSGLRVAGALGHGLDSYTNGRKVVADYGGSVGQLLERLSR